MFKLTLKTLKTSFLVTILLLFISCTEEPAEPTDGVDGQDGFNALVEVQNEEIGDNCSTGGIRISVGQDKNENGVLDEDEIASTSFICNGVSGSNGSDGSGLVARSSPENPGSNCQNGGTLIEIGADLNNNNALETEEIQTSFYVCNGSDGSGEGSNGLNSLIRATPIEDCGGKGISGIRIEIGLDSNRNGVLDGDVNEIQSTYDLCNGTNGQDGINSILSCSTEDPGDNCPNGGISIAIGLDSNGNGLLDEGEVIGEPKFVCNGANGNDGKSPIVTSTTDVSCSNGGIELTFGYDNDNNGTIDEVLETVTICNGENGSDGSNGLNSIIRTSPSTNCADGGTLVQVGIDDNANGTLEAGEVDSSFDVCNGANGNNGSNGLNSVVDVRTFTGNAGSCNTNDGGIVIRVGIDDNGNGSLDIPGEVDQTQYICNGNDGVDGNSDGIFEFYYANGFDDYTAMTDVTIIENSPDNTVDAELLRVSVNVETGKVNSLLHFPGVEKITESISGEYYIVQAILYLRATSSSKDNSDDNWIGVKAIRPELELFGEDKATWRSPNGGTWLNADAGFSDQDTYAFSDLFRVPGTFDYSGTIPLLLDRSQIQAWITDPDRNNKGLALELGDDGRSLNFILDIFSSENTTDATYVPTLYIKAKLGKANGRSVQLTDEQYKQHWSEMSYEEKIAPLQKRNNN